MDKYVDGLKYNAEEFDASWIPYDFNVLSCTDTGNVNSRFREKKYIALILKYLYRIDKIQSDINVEMHRGFNSLTLSSSDGHPYKNVSNEKMLLLKREISAIKIILEHINTKNVSVIFRKEVYNPTIEALWSYSLLFQLNHKEITISEKVEDFSINVVILIFKFLVIVAVFAIIGKCSTS